MATNKAYCLQSQSQAAKLGLIFFPFTNLAILLYYNTSHYVMDEVLQLIVKYLGLRRKKTRLNLRKTTPPPPKRQKR